MTFEHKFTPPKRRASAMLALVIMMGLISGVLSFGIAKSSAVSINSISASKTAIEASNLAQNEAALVRATNYTDLAAQTRVLIPNTSYDKEILLSAENDYSESIKERTSIIHIYKSGESIPRITLTVKRYSVENVDSGSGVPVGTVIAWPGTATPGTNGTWLECNGQSCAAYPALVAVLGKNTVPDYRNRFLESSTIAGKIKEAGIPNITGSFSFEANAVGYTGSPNPDGAFYRVARSDFKHGAFNTESGSSRVHFDASRSSSVYGNSVTVQPASVTVRRFIKAA